MWWVYHYFTSHCFKEIDRANFFVMPTSRSSSCCCDQSFRSRTCEHTIPLSCSAPTSSINSVLTWWQWSVQKILLVWSIFWILRHTVWSTVLMTLRLCFKNNKSWHFRGVILVFKKSAYDDSITKRQALSGHMDLYKPNSHFFIKKKKKQKTSSK